MPVMDFFTKAATKMAQPDLDRHLVLAAQEGDIEKMKTLIKQGASIDGRDASEDTPLIGAAREDKLEAVKFLLKQGADPTLQNGIGKTALLIALCDHVAEEISLTLVKTGKALDAVDMHGNPAAFYAAQYGHPKVLEALAEGGADMAKPGKYGTTPLMRAIEVGQIDAGRTLIGEKLVPAVGIDMQDNNGSTVLALAVENKRDIFVMSFIALGANADLKDKQGRTPYSIAEETGQTAICRALEEQRAKKYAVAASATVKTMKTISLRTGATP
ncbi:MAG: ankyrin repeat domain-containing protein [Alphaproteobacteria bacterium]